ncbi:MAG: hypothetical protein AB7F31_01245 [Parachlamydiales bacterium]
MRLLLPLLLLLTPLRAALWSDWQAVGRVEGYYGSRVAALADVFVPIAGDERTLVYADGRLWHYRQGAYEYNAGAGIRFLDPCCRFIAGGYLFYDGLKTTPLAIPFEQNGMVELCNGPVPLSPDLLFPCVCNFPSFHRVTFGFELLSCIGGARLNVYVPVGRKAKLAGQFPTGIVSGNDLIILNRDRYVACQPAIEWEIGARIPRLPCLKTFIGSYHFLHHEGAAGTSGVQARIEAKLSSWLNFRLIERWDPIRKNQLLFGLEFHLGGKPCKPVHCPLACQMTSRVVRDLGLLFNGGCTTRFGQSVVKSIPIEVIFVDNLAPPGGDGTLQMPYQTIIQAAATAEFAAGTPVYVFEGGPNYALPGNNLMVVAGQTFQGSGSPLVFNLVEIFPADGFPTLEGAVTAATNSTLMGFNLIQGSTAETAGIQGTGVSNVTLCCLNISDYTAPTSFGISMSDVNTLFMREITVSSIFGSAGMAGVDGVGAGASGGNGTDGGVATGISILSGSNITGLELTISNIQGGAGGSGGNGQPGANGANGLNGFPTTPGTAGGPGQPGGDGGNAGMGGAAYGFVLPSVQLANLSAITLSDIAGGAGGDPGFGAGGGAGGAGGKGGVSTVGIDPNIPGGNGGSGGAGGMGGSGGLPGDGGAATGLSAPMGLFILEGVAIQGVSGGSGGGLMQPGVGGNGGAGGAGGDGGDWTNGVVNSIPAAGGGNGGIGGSGGNGGDGSRGGLGGGVYGLAAPAGTATLRQVNIVDVQGGDGAPSGQPGSGGVGRPGGDGGVRPAAALAGQGIGNNGDGGAGGRGGDGGNGGMPGKGGDATGALLSGSQDLQLESIAIQTVVAGNGGGTPLASNGGHGGAGGGGSRFDSFRTLARPGGAGGAGGVGGAMALPAIGGSAIGADISNANGVTGQILVLQEIRAGAPGAATPGGGAGGNGGGGGNGSFAKLPPLTPMNGGVGGAGGLSGAGGSITGVSGPGGRAVGLSLDGATGNLSFDDLTVQDVLAGDGISNGSGGNGGNGGAGGDGGATFVNSVEALVGNGGNGGAGGAGGMVPEAGSGGEAVGISAFGVGSDLALSSFVVQRTGGGAASPSGSGGQGGNGGVGGSSQVLNEVLAGTGGDGGDGGAGGSVGAGGAGGSATGVDARGGLTITFGTGSVIDVVGRDGASGGNGGNGGSGAAAGPGFPDGSPGMAGAGGDGGDGGSGGDATGYNTTGTVRNIDPPASGVVAGSGGAAGTGGTPGGANGTPGISGNANDRLPPP